MKSDDLKIGQYEADDEDAASGKPKTHYNVIRIEDGDVFYQRIGDAVATVMRSSFEEFIALLGPQGRIVEAHELPRIIRPEYQD